MRASRRPHAARPTAIRFIQVARAVRAIRIVQRVTPDAAHVADQLYARWNEGDLSNLIDNVDPGVEIVCDPLCPDESTLRGLEGWKQWVSRWDQNYKSMHITIDGLIPMSNEHVLALVSITATPRGSDQQLTWAAAHVWTIQEGRIARYETHVDIALARGTLL